LSGNSLSPLEAEMNGPVSPSAPNPTQPPVLTVCLLGGFALTYCGEPVTTVKTSRLQTLFAYLLLHRQAAHARRQLAFLLWPDSTQGQALTNLRKQLLYLQQALPAADSFLHIERGSVQWRPDAQVRLDVAEFEHALNQAAGAQGDQARLALADAVTHFRGELFPDCYDEWIFPLRERLREQFVYGLERLVHLCEAEQLYDEAIEYAQRLLQHDPLRESSYRQLMRLYAVNGDRALALRTYHTCVTQLNEELGVEPDGETQAAYERLLNHQPAEEAVSTVAASTPLVGRQREWQTLQHRWRRAARGQAHFVLLIGEAGIGKTRLAEELLAWAHRQGIATARTRSYAAEGKLAYAPVVEWLRSDAFTAKLRQVETAWLPELARLLPELAANADTVTPSPSQNWQPQSWQRLRLFEALAQALLAGQEQRLLVIDDLQWCDQETLEWLRYFMRYALTARVLVVGTMRPEEVTADHPLVTFVNEVRTAGQLTEIVLEALSAEETTKLAEHLTATALDATTVAQLYAATEGHPLFVVEMVRAQGETTLRQIVNGHNTEWTPAADSAPSAPAPLPPKIHGVIAARLSHLSPVARQVATLAAVVGRAFSAANLASHLPGGWPDARCIALLVIISITSPPRLRNDCGTIRLLYSVCTYYVARPSHAFIPPWGITPLAVNLPSQKESNDYSKPKFRVP
jgi:DNA-binding SARP family transcriptional activator